MNTDASKILLALSSITVENEVRIMALRELLIEKEVATQKEIEDKIELIRERDTEKIKAALKKLYDACDENF